MAGHLAFADLEHVGRKSGTVRHTPVRAFRSGDTVIVGLNFGRQSDWYQNIKAAGTCRMRLGGEQLTLGAPALVPAAVRAENLVRRCDQQSCSRCRPVVMITDHVPAVRLPLDHARILMAAAVAA
jgi:deazaflavin-dependent oxidoreductase (nitroreductase family)